MSEFKVGEVDLWISIGTDSGLAVATLGDLEGRSDLIQGTLMTLKSIVTTEVGTSEDSDFLKGDTDLSHYGVRNIGEHEGSMVIVQYILKSQVPDVITDWHVNVANEVAEGFALQLMQSIQFAEAIQFGRAVDRDIVLKAYMNTCQLMRQRFKIPSDDYAIDALVKRLYEEGKNNMDLPIFSKIRETVSKDPTIWQSNGSINLATRNSFLNQLTTDILYNLILENPGELLYYPRPRKIVASITPIIVSYLADLNSALNEAYEKYISDESLEKTITTLTKRLTVDELHSVNINLSRLASIHFLKGLVKKNPLFAVLDLRESEIFEMIQTKIEQFSSIPSLLDILGSIISVNDDKIQSKYLTKFLESFLAKLQADFLSDNEWSILTSFILAQIEKPIILSAIDNLEVPVASWRRDLRKYFNKKKSPRLNMSHISEVVRFSSALHSSIIDALQFVIEDQFLSNNSDGGVLLNSLGEMYSSIGPSFFLTSLFKKFLGALTSIDKENLAFLNFDLSDFLSPLIQKKVLKLLFKGEPCNFTTSDNLLYVTLENNEKHLFVDVYKNNESDFAYVLLQDGLESEEGLSLQEIKSNIDMFLLILSSPFTLSSVLATSYSRNSRLLIDDYIMNLTAHYNTVFAGISGGIEDVLEKKKEVSSLLSLFPAVNSEPPDEIFDRASLVPKAIMDLQEKVKTEFSNFWKDIEQQLAKEIKKALSKVNFPDDYLQETDIKQVNNLLSKATSKWNKIEGKLKKIENSANKLKKSSLKSFEKILRIFELEAQIRISAISNEIFINSETMPFPTVLSIADLRDSVSSHWQSFSDRIGKEYYVDFLRVGISLSLFDEVPAYVVDDVYSDFIRHGYKYYSVYGGVQSRSVFESRIAVNFRPLKNILKEIVLDILNYTNSKFLLNNRPIQHSSSNVFVGFEHELSPCFDTSEKVQNIFEIDGLSVKVDESKMSFMVFLPKWEQSGYDKSHVDTLSKYMMYSLFSRFQRDTTPLITGLKGISTYLSEEEQENLDRLWESTQQSIYDPSSVPPGIEISSQHTPTSPPIELDEEVNTLLTEYLDTHNLEEKVMPVVSKSTINKLHYIDIEASEFLANDFIKFYKNNEDTSHLPIEGFKTLISSRMQVDVNELDLPNTYQILSEINGITGEFVKEFHADFLRTFLSELRGFPLSDAEWAVITSFMLTYNKKEEILSSIDSLNLQVPKWKHSLNDIFSAKTKTRLQLPTISQAFHFSSAVKSTILQVVLSVVQNLFGFSTEFGSLVDKMADNYVDVGKNIRLLTLFQVFAKEVDKACDKAEVQVDITISDFLSACIQRSLLVVKHKEKDVVYNNEGNSISLNLPNGSFPLFEVYKDPELTYTFFLDEITQKTVKLEDIPRDRDILLTIFTNSELLKLALIHAYERKINREFTDYASFMISLYQDMFQGLQETVQKILDGELDMQALSDLSLPENVFKHFQKTKTFPQVPSDFPAEFSEMLLSEWTKAQGKLKGDFDRTLSKVSLGDHKIREYDRPSVLNFLHKISSPATKFDKRIPSLFKDINKEKRYRFAAFLVYADSFAGKMYQKITDSRGAILHYNTSPGCLVFPTKQEIKYHLSGRREVLYRELKEKYHERFIEIGTSLYLFNEIPSNVVEDIYNELLGGGEHKYPWLIESISSREEFELKLRSRFQPLASIINDIVRLDLAAIEKQFVLEDGELSIDSKGLYIPLGLFSSKIFRDASSIGSIIDVENCILVKRRRKWNLLVYLPGWSTDRKTESGLVTLSDAIRSFLYSEFKNETDVLIQALRRVSNYRRSVESHNLRNLWSSISKSIYEF